MRPESTPSAIRASTDLQAVFFDMDGLLVDSENTWYAAECDLAVELGADGWTREQQAAILGGPMSRAAAYIQQATGTDWTAEQISDRLKELVVHRLRTDLVSWMPGAKELLLSLRRATVPVALVSASTRAMVDAVLDAVSHDIPAELGGPFDTTVAGDEVPRTKPHADPYLLAAERLGVDPACCVVLEDSATGVAAGTAAGCVVVAVPSLEPIEAAPRRHVRTALTEVDLAALRALVATETDSVRGDGA